MSLEFSSHDSSYYTAFSLSSHSSVFCCKRRGKNYEFHQLHYPLEQDYGLKKMGLARFRKYMFNFACFDKDHIWLNMLQREFISQENGDISIFAFPLATVISFCHTVACNFLDLWTSTCQVCSCLYINVVHEIKSSQILSTETINIH